MSRPLAPRAPPGDFTGVPGAPGAGGIQLNHLTPQRPKKISTACGACKQRKTRCTGNSPCDACVARDSPCVYDATSDQRRKIANHRNVQDLAEAHVTLERQKQLLGGLLATIRAGSDQEVQDLLSLVRQGIDLSQLAAHVRNACRSSMLIQQIYDQIDFTIDGEDKLPDSAQMFGFVLPTSSGSAESRSPFSDGGGDTQYGFHDNHGNEENP